MKQLKPQDAQFLFMEDGKIASHVTSVMICDQSTAPEGLVRFKEILSTVETRLGNAPLYSQKLQRLPFNVDFPYWVEDPDFDLEYHVRHGRLPEPGDWRQLCIHIARFHSRPLDMTRPPWEIYVIEGLDHVENYPEGSFALVVKMHHSAVDGTSAQEFMFSMMDVGADGPPLIPPPSRRSLMRDRPASTSQLLTRAAMHNTLAPLKLARATAKLTPTLARAAASRLLNGKREDRHIPRTRFNGDVSPNRAFDAVSFSLADFRAIARAFDEAKINDVVLAVVSGALRTYLSAKNELPDGSLVIMAPVNKRGSEASEAENEGNNISAMTVPLFTNLPDPVERLKAITRASGEAKSARSGLGARLAADLSKHIPPFTMATLGPILINSGAAAQQTGANAIVSNVPGVQFPLYFCGAEVLDCYGLAPIGGGLGLFIATPSYNGKITFSITTTRQIMPDTPFFVSCLREALAELADRAETLGARPKKAPRQRRQIHRVSPPKAPAARKPAAPAAKQKAAAAPKSPPAKATRKTASKTSTKPKAKSSARKGKSKKA